MKAVVLTLLAIGLALQPSSALQCYFCDAQVSNEDCLNVTKCARSDTYCWTERICAVGFLTILSKGCSKECVEDSENYLLAKKNIACCSTDLCDFSGAHALQPPLVTMVPLPALGGLLLWGPSQV